MIYETIQGDTFDGIAFKVYGEEKYMKEIIQANPDYADVLVFSPNVKLTLPAVEEGMDVEDLPFWREDDDDIEDDEEDDDDYEE